MGQSTAALLFLFLTASLCSPRVRNGLVESQRRVQVHDPLLPRQRLLLYQRLHRPKPCIPRPRPLPLNPFPHLLGILLLHRPRQPRLRPRHPPNLRLLHLLRLRSPAPNLPRRNLRNERPPQHHMEPRHIRPPLELHPPIPRSQLPLKRIPPRIGFNPMGPLREQHLLRSNLLKILEHIKNRPQPQPRDRQHGLPSPDLQLLRGRDRPPLTLLLLVLQRNAL